MPRGARATRSTTAPRTSAAEVVDYPPLCEDVCRQVLDGARRLRDRRRRQRLGRGDRLQQDPRHPRRALPRPLGRPRSRAANNDANVLVTGAKVRRARLRRADPRAVAGDVVPRRAARRAARSDRGARARRVAALKEREDARGRGVARSAPRAARPSTPTAAGTPRGTAPPRSRGSGRGPGRRAPGPRARSAPPAPGPGTVSRSKSARAMSATTRAVLARVAVGRTRRRTRRRARRTLAHGPTRGSCANVSSLVARELDDRRRGPCSADERRVLGEARALRHAVPRAARRASTARAARRARGSATASVERDRAADAAADQVRALDPEVVEERGSLARVVRPRRSARPDRPTRPDSRLSNAMHVNRAREVLEQVRAARRCRTRVQFSIVALKPPGENSSSGGPSPTSS